MSSRLLDDILHQNSIGNGNDTAFMLQRGTDGVDLDNRAPDALHLNRPSYGEMVTHKRSRKDVGHNGTASEAESQSSRQASRGQNNRQDHSEDCSLHAQLSQSNDDGDQRKKVATNNAQGVGIFQVRIARRPSQGARQQ